MEIRMNFHKLLSEKTQDIEKRIFQYMPRCSGRQAMIVEAMRYSVEAGGKRLRPLLLEESAKLFGAEQKVVDAFMAAIEMIHTYSLVHDDLPCMDDDMYRRGKKTTHAVFGEDMGVLTGDALLNYAYETALSSFEHTKHPDRVASALQILAHKSGIFGMVGGQVIDVHPQDDSMETLNEIYRLKTGALLEAAMTCGAVLGGAQSERVQLLEDTASALGLAFQIRDDILDVTGDESEIGKPLHSDEKNEKMTYVARCGVEKSEREVGRLTDRAVDNLHKLDADTQFLECLFRYLTERRK